MLNLHRFGDLQCPFLNGDYIIEVKLFLRKLHNVSRYPQF